ncbi:hypothetical protein UFOVP165_5 [uncultured Caudovirales phage]|uniref:Uncharacterized protein n=1 Tax=uncultured Caudovirales phage TaxID=2100421 RepID=A0A6J5TCG5_9CAUD|nr:hypothetical protein UFOVP72_34 [uncultured Caudovirales phage]CAB5187128.1 hypothetical protein UFOVP165_5 [uncultured Caudovirales phage]
MWTHLCTAYKTLVAVEIGCPCNWCNADERICEGV